MRSRHREVAVALFFGAITLLASPIFGQTTFWTDGTGNWFTSSNWSLGTPAAGNNAEIDNGGTAQIATAGAVCLNLELAINNTTDSGTVSVSGVGTLSAPNGMQIGYLGTGTLNLSAGGTASSHDCIISLSSGSTGHVTVDGAGSKLTTTDIISVGEGGPGSLDVTTGGAVASFGGIIGDATTAVGVATVNGVNSNWTMSGFLIVGFEGNGTLNIQNHGTVSDADAYLGGATFSLSTFHPVATVNVDGSGSTWTNSATLTVGEATGSTATLNITNGGTVTNTIGMIGDKSGSTGTVTVNSSTWTNSGDLTVGGSGTGTLHITTLGTVSSVNGVIGNAAGSHGIVTVDGGFFIPFPFPHFVSSEWTMSGDLTVGNGGTGTLSITNGGFVSSVAGEIGKGSNGIGGVTVDDSGSSWTNSNHVNVGLDGSGTLQITNGGTVSDSTGTIAYGTGSGAVTVSGTGSTWTNNGSVAVGYIGSGTLDITSGGTVTSIGPSVIGSFSPSTGIVTITGTGSTWTNTGDLDVGGDGKATLNITSGGALSNSTGYIGHYSGSGTATVDGTGSTWTNSGSFDVGLDGHGTLNITNGGTVTVNGSFARIAEHANSTGAVTVDGAGSTWRLVHELDVARAGTGTLTIQNGGIVNMIGSDRAAIGVLAGSNGTLNILTGGTFTGFDAFIAQEDGSTGLAVVNGAGGASTLQLGGNLFVGGDGTGPHGTGVLRVLNGGIVNSNRLVVLSPGTLEIGVNPVITVTNPLGIEYDGGKLKTIADTTLTNKGSLQTGGVILDSNGFTSTLSGVYSGSGGVSKIGAGTIVLTNTNTYTGTTVINAGVLQVDGSISSTTFVNAGGTLAGSGTIASASVINRGIVSPGTSPGTLTIGGGYGQTNTGTLRIEIGGLALAQHDLLSVGTAASLAGTLQVVRFNNFQPANGDRVTFLTDNGGHTGIFDTVTSNFGLLQPVVHYDEANDVYLIFQLGSFNIGGLTPNQKSVALNLNNAANDPAAAALINFLVGEPMGALPHDYDLIAPEELAAIYEIGISQSMVQNNNLQRRMDDIRAGSNGFCANGFTPQVSGKDYTKESDGKVSLPDKSTRDVYTPAPDNRWGIFVTGTGDFVNVSNNDFNAHGYDIATGDFTVGADYRLCDHFAIGIDAGYSRSTADLVDNGRVDVDGGKIGAYATLFGKGLFGSKYYVDAGVGGGLNDYATRRTGLQDELVRGDTNGTEFNAFIAYGSDWTFGCFNVGTWSTVQYTNVSIDQFTETGSLAPLVIEDQDENSFRSTTGVHASYDIKSGHAIFRPEVRVAYQHEYCDSAYQIDSQLASGAGGIFRVRGPRIGRDAALVGAGMNMQWNNRLATYVYYDGVLGRNNYDNNAVSGGFRIGF